MKKFFILFTLALSLVYAKDSVEFKYAPKNIERNFPTAQNQILSYNNILENVRTNIVNISIKKEIKGNLYSANPFFNDPFFREFFKGYGDIPQERIQKSLGSGVIISKDGYMVTSIATSLIESGKFTRAYLGVTIADVSQDMSSFYDENYGALITGVEENSPAAKAGLKRGDLIISINGKKIESASELKNTIGSYAPKKVVNIKFLRDKKIDIVNVTLATLDSKVVIGEFEYKGMKLSEITPTHKQQFNITIEGVLVEEVDQNSEAFGSGIRDGDIIIQIENTEIANLDEFKKATASKSKKRFFIYRRGGIFATVL